MRVKHFITTPVGKLSAPPWWVDVRFRADGWPDRRSTIGRAVHSWMVDSVLPRALRCFVRDRDCPSSMVRHDPRPW